VGLVAGRRVLRAGRDGPGRDRIVDAHHGGAVLLGVQAARTGLGWFTGWFNLLGQIAVTASIDYSAAVFTTALGNIWFPALDTGPTTIFIVYTVIVALHLLLNLLGATQDRFGRVDVAFNNAGISPPDDDSILVTGLDAWRRVQDVNLTSVYLCCKAAIPYMQRQGRGSIINTASFVAVLGAATSQISYTASKGGVLAMSRELGVQFAREGIRVNALCPGPVDTPLLRKLFAADPERAQRRLIHVPMGRFAKPTEIAAAVACLASDDASFISASTFLVDGGISGAYVTPL
jgi:NAD(P)-dependent dehydrogenase (short-subunit alcohol dehydrogenase family)